MNPKVLPTVAERVHLAYDIFLLRVKLSSLFCNGVVIGGWWVVYFSAYSYS